MKGSGHTRFTRMTSNRLLHLGPLTFAAALIPSSGLNAQEDRTVTDDGVIVVTGTALPEPPAAPAYGSVTIEREVLVTMPSGRIEDALAYVAGFQQFRRSDSRSANPSAQGTTLRSLGGNATSRALVLLDGVPMADPFFGFIPFNAIAPERLASVRVTRGGGSGPFGAGALAGTIELTSAGADELGTLGGHAYLNDRLETETALHASGALGAGFGSVSARWDRGKGFFTTPLDTRVDANARAAFDAFSVQARGLIPVGDTMELQARGLIYDDRRTLRFDGADSSSTGQDASLRLIGRGDWQFDVLGYLQARNFTNTVISSTQFVPVLDQRNTPSTGVGGKVEVRPPLGPDTVLRLGADYRRSSGELYETAISSFTGAVRERRNAGGTNSNFGLFAENDLLIGALTLTAGARLDRYSIDDGFFRTRDSDGFALEDTVFPDRKGWETSLRAGGLYDFDNGLTMRAAAYTGLRLPTLNELYRPFVVFPVTTLANADLRIRTTRGFRSGHRLQTKRGLASLAHGVRQPCEGCDCQRHSGRSHSPAA